MEVYIDDKGVHGIALLIYKMSPQLTEMGSSLCKVSTSRNEKKVKVVSQT